MNKIDLWSINDSWWELRNKIANTLDRFLPQELDIFPDDLARIILEDAFVLKQLKNFTGN